MDTLEKSLEMAMRETPYILAANLVAKKLSADGIELTEKEKRLLAAHLQDSGQELFSLKRGSEGSSTRNVVISEAETREIIAKIERFFEEDFPDIVQRLISDFGERIFKDLKRKWTAESGLQSKEIAKFRRRLEKRWRVPLEKLRMLITMARELGSNGINGLQPHDRRASRTFQPLSDGNSRCFQSN